ncbi:Rossmann-like and DUF2520 domain-containing protein [Solicola gregarius]|uniref:DUF2520 domain-containing protein n=1 Tax=Solicola gregarius TaxID=2908642 RepID=A0AA46TKK1_9ACTN|nr:Rossmann-like and DUF2520 domain-containing protein [Solicola gregarius]UYM06985.1 DUF2520 domain-containing protein [Solicola gregarius]
MRRFSIGVVGAGRVGAVLAAAFVASGHQVTAVSGRSPASQTRIETLLPGIPVRDPARVAASADILLLAVPDDVLERTAASLAESGSIGSGQVAVHTSGRHGVDVLAAPAEAGAAVLAMHPAMTFTGTDVDLGRLASTVFALTGGDAVRDTGEALVAGLGGTPVWLSEDQRVLYHAALAHGANHLVTLVTQAQELLRSTGMPDPSGVLRPLLSAALDNALAYGDAALTGPVVRGDVATVEAHVDALADAPGPIRDAYVSMARATTEHAVASGSLDGGRGRDLKRVLDEADWDSLAQIAAGIR